MEAMEKHDAIQSFNLKSLSGSLNDMTAYDEDGFSQSQRAMSQATTFATQFTATSNMSFNKLLVNFQPNSQIHKEMLAILAALTEIIKEKGGNETSTEYFLALMETIENVKENSELQASLALLNMGIKSVPEAVLRKKFNETAEVLLNLVARFAEGEGNVLKTVISCLSVVLRAQEFASWKLSSTMKFFDAILTFTTHTKPRVRKAAQHAVASVLFGSCFLLPPKKEGGDNENEELTLSSPKIIHPASSRVAKFCIDKFKPEIINNNQTLLLHVLTMLQTVVASFPRDDIKAISENLLSIMTSGSILVRTSCFQTFYSLFNSKNENLPAQLAGRLISALSEYRPDRSDFRQILAWITVMKAAHVKLFSLGELFICFKDIEINLNWFLILDRDACIQALPQFFDVCVNDIWMSDSVDVVAGTSNALKEILEDCVKTLKDPPVFYFSSFKKIISIITKALAAPFGASSNHILLICGIAFEALGQHCGDEFEEAMIVLGQRYEENSAQRVHIEHAIFAAISSIETSRVLKCIPLTDIHGTMSVKRSWLLPLLREGLQNSSFEYFNRNIIKLAFDCYEKWQKFKENGKTSEAHIYELLCCQLWGLFPGFCRRPKDIHNFKLIAKTLGDVLNKNPDLRPPILDGFKELLSNLESDEDKEILAKYSENYLTRFFNIYTSKPNTSYERETRTLTFEVLQLYLKITPKPTLDKLFTNATDQMTSKIPGSFVYDSIFDIVETLALYQSCEKLTELYKSFIVTTLVKDKKKDGNGDVKKDNNLRRRLKKSYKLLQDLMSAETEGCIDFVIAELNNIEKILSSSSYKVIEGTQVMRLACINLLLEKRHEIIDVDNSKIIKIAISEALAGFNNEAVVKDGIAYNLLRTVAKIFSDNGKLNEFVDAVMVGMIGNDHQLISNTIFALKFILQEFGEHMTVETLKFMLDQVLEFLVSNQRNEANASLYFIATFVKLLPTAFVVNHLAIIVKAISLMVDDCRRHSRQVLGYLMKKLCKRFTPEEIIKLVPGTDEVLHKRLKVIRKQMTKAKKNQMDQMKSKKKAGNDDSDDDELLNVEKKSMT
jgi:ribosomal RNA-processing protein 12